MSQNAADRRTLTRRLALIALGCAPMLLADMAAAQPDRGRGRGRDRGERSERYEGPQRRERFDDRGRERYEGRGRDRGGERSYAPRGYEDGASDRGLRRGGTLPPQARGGRVENYERYRLRQPPRGYSWYRSGDGFALVGPNGVVFDVID